MKPTRKLRMKQAIRIPAWQDREGKRHGEGVRVLDLFALPNLVYFGMKGSIKDLRTTKGHCSLVPL